MALISCPECGKEISDKAVTCPNCGFPLQEHVTRPNKEPSPKTVAYPNDATSLQKPSLRPNDGQECMINIPAFRDRSKTFVHKLDTVRIEDDEHRVLYEGISDLTATINVHRTERIHIIWEKALPSYTGKDMLIMLLLLPTIIGTAIYGAVKAGNKKKFQDWEICIGLVSPGKKYICKCVKSFQWCLSEVDAIID